MVCLSRISPIRMQSGAWRSAFSQGDLEALGVGADFALVDDGFLVLEDEFDRVFQRQDVAGLLLVAQVQHRRQRGRLARAGGADHQDQPALLHDDFLEDVGQAEGGEGRHAAGDEAHHHRGRAFLAEGADAERAHALQRVSGVQLPLVLVFLDLALGQHLVEQRLHRVRVQDGLVDRDRHAVDLDVDRRADRQEDVRRLLLGHHLEQTLHCRHAALPKMPDPLV